MVTKLITNTFSKDPVQIELFDKKGITAVTLGKGSYISGAELGLSDDGDSHLLIGNYTSIAHNTYFEVGMNHDYGRFSNYPFEVVANITGDWEIDGDHAPISGERNPKQIIIGNDVWIGANVIIMGGVRIGNGAVIGAGAVVAKDIPPYAIAAGNPVRVIKYRFSEDMIQKLQQLKWWDWPAEKINEALPLLGDVESFLEKYYQGSSKHKEDQLAQEIRLLHRDYAFYHLRPDLHSEEQLWRRFVRRYVKKENSQSKKILLLWLDASSEAEQASDEVRLMLDEAGENAPYIMTYHGDRAVMESIIEEMDVIVTTKTFISLEILDSIHSEYVKRLFVNDY